MRKPVRVYFKGFAALLMSAVLFSADAEAKDLVITNSAKSTDDVRFNYPYAVLEMALERTVDRYGPYELKRFSRVVSRKRALRELVSGGITVFSTPTRQEWEAAAIPIRVPIRKGILGYKLMLIRQEDQSKFSTVQTADDLKKYRFGGGQQWSSSLAMQRHGFRVFGGTDYEPLFAMLSGNRFDYFPRGVNEIFAEYDSRKNKFPNMAIEQELAIYLPLPTYFFVSPAKPRLAQRVKEGLLSIVEDGTLDQMFYDSHREALERANLANRKIISLKNYNLSDETPLHRAELWYQPKK